MKNQNRIYFYLIYMYVYNIHIIIHKLSRLQKNNNKCIEFVLIVLERNILIP